MTRGPVRAHALVLCLLIGVTLSAGCGDDDTAEADATAYVVALDHFLQPAPPASDANEGEVELPIVYIAPTDDPLALDLQVGVIDEVADRLDVRFVDDYHAALDDDSGRPHDEARLLGLGTLSEDQPHLVRIEVFDPAGEASAYLVEVRRDGPTWVVGEVTEVEPEELVGDE
jgi:hypothetical protein